MVAQNNGKIYKVQNIAGDKIYIGSTNKKYLSQRMDTYRGDFKKWERGIHSFVRCFDIFTEYELKNCVIVLLESFPCESKDALNAREAYFIETLDCLNKTKRTEGDIERDDERKKNLDKGINDIDEY